MNQIDMVVSVKTLQADGKTYKNVPSNKVKVTLFNLKDFGLTEVDATIAEDGTSSYADSKLQYLQDALTNAIKADARNSLKTATDGSGIAHTLADLVAPTEGAGGGQYLKTFKAFSTAFTAFLASTDKSVAVQTIYNSLVANASTAKGRAVISLTPAKVKAGLQVQLAAFTAQCEEVESYEQILMQLDEACSPVNMELDY